MTSRIFSYLFVLVPAIVALAGCSQKPTPEPPPLVPVTVSQPLTQQVSRYVLINGRSKESEVFEARARVEGKLEQSTFLEGALVTQGQIVFEIEKEQFQSDLNAANAQLKAAQAQVESAKALKLTAEAQEKSAVAAHDLAVAELKRTQALFDKQVATQAELELNQAQEKVAFANIDAAKAALSDAEAAMLVAVAAIDREQANKEQVEIQLAYTTIHAEIEGLAGELLVDPGNIVGRGETTLLTTIRKIDPLDIYFEAPERVVLNHLRAIYEGRRKENREVTLEIQFEGETGYPHRGELILLDNQIDPNTGTALLKGQIPNPYRGQGDETKIPFKERQYLLRPGAYANIRIQTEPIPDAVLIHETAIATDLSGKYILIVNEDNTVEQRRVRLGQRYHDFRHIEAIWKSDEVEPETTGETIDTNFRYILEGMLRARPGIEVDVKEEVKLTYPAEESASTSDKNDNRVAPDETPEEDDSESNTASDTKSATPEFGPPKES